jgi:hypothetical protein
LAAWGEQAAAADESVRTAEQQQLAAAWTTLLQDWKAVLEGKGIQQPRGAERYQEVEIIERETGSKDIKFIGEEKYSLYLEQIETKRIREEQQGGAGDEDSIREQARRLIREYNKQVKEIIGY